LSQKNGNNIVRKIQRGSGAFLLRLAPYLMKSLSIVGTIAMFMVGGGILAHGIPGAHQWVEHVAHGAGGISGMGRILETVLPLLLAGMGVWAGVRGAKKIFRRFKRAR
jgi:predicted DNA repair protein MutK